MTDRTHLKGDSSLGSTRMPATARPRTSVAEYVRMSTDMQTYSLSNQQARIGDFANARGYDIVASYQDGAKSGLTLQDRPAMRELLEEILSGNAPFSRLLVYDVSRWGRFQDVDEGAHYEYLCRRAGVEIDYCAEPFENDGSSFAGMVKGLKRVMAAEYSRELSAKVAAGKVRILHEGFRSCGGPPPYGYSRLMIDARGNAKAILKKGERKAVLTYRIVLALGSEDERSTVQAIFSDYIAGMTMWQIANRLNANRTSGGRPKQWCQANIRKILTSETYVGTLVACTRRSRLGTNKAVDRENWLRIPNSHPALVSQETFDAAQRVRIERLGSRPTQDAVAAQILDIYQTHGKVTHQLLDQRNLLSRSTRLSRFGGLNQLMETCGLPTKRPKRFLDRQQVADRVTEVLDHLLNMLVLRGLSVTVDAKHKIAQLSNGCRIHAAVAYAGIESGRPAWRISGWRADIAADIGLVALLNDTNVEIEGWIFLPRNSWPVDSGFGFKRLQQWLLHLGTSIDDLWLHLEQLAT